MAGAPLLPSLPSPAGRSSWTGGCGVTGHLGACGAWAPVPHRSLLSRRPRGGLSPAGPVCDAGPVAAPLWGPSSPCSRWEVPFGDTHVHCCSPGGRSLLWRLRAPSALTASLLPSSESLSGRRLSRVQLLNLTLVAPRFLGTSGGKAGASGPSALPSPFAKAGGESRGRGGGVHPTEKEGCQGPWLAQGRGQDLLATGA